MSSDEPPRVYLDTETSGLTPGDIVEVAIIDDAGEVLLHTRCVPSCPIEPGAARIHGITLALLADCPPSAEVKARVADIVRDKHVIIYNADFDRRFVDISTAAKVSCCMQAYAAYHGAWSEYHQSYTWQRLSVAAAAVKHAWTGAAHGALADALACRSVWHAMQDA